MSSDVKTKFASEGRVWLRQAVAGSDLTTLNALCQTGQRPGARVSADDPLFQAVKTLPVLQEIAQLWPGMRPVRLVAFNKNDVSNWSVPWHQDRVIAVDRRADLQGYSNWGRKADVWHCTPPLELLENMLFVRLHLDPSTADNGAMEIAVGSHHHGDVSADQAVDVAATCRGELTIADPGDVLILSMLTLHRSRPAETSQNRAVLRIDLSAQNPAPPLQWAI